MVTYVIWKGRTQPSKQTAIKVQIQNKRKNYQQSPLQPFQHYLSFFTVDPPPSPANIKFRLILGCRRKADYYIYTKTTILTEIYSCNFGRGWEVEGGTTLAKTHQIGHPRIACFDTNTKRSPKKRPILMVHC